MVIDIFKLSDQQCSKLQEWMQEQDSKYLAQQKQQAQAILAQSTDSNKREVRWAKGVISSDRPFSLAADSGYYIYSFFPMTLGTKVSVMHTATGESIDLSEYDSW